MRHEKENWLKEQMIKRDTNAVNSFAMQQQLKRIEDKLDILLNVLADVEQSRC